MQAAIISRIRVLGVSRICADSGSILERLSFNESATMPRKTLSPPSTLIVNRGASNRCEPGDSNAYDAPVVEVSKVLRIGLPLTTPSIVAMYLSEPLSMKIPTRMIPPYWKQVLLMPWVFSGIRTQRQSETS